MVGCVQCGLTSMTYMSVGQEYHISGPCMVHVCDIYVAYVDRAASAPKRPWLVGSSEQGNWLDSELLPYDR